LAERILIDPRSTFAQSGIDSISTGKAMKEFTFRAPTLFDPSATASGEEKDALHDAPGAAEHLAKTRKFAFWLKSVMVNKGLPAVDPYLAEGGWHIDVPCGSGRAGERPFVLCTIGGRLGDDSLFELLVVEIGGATKDVGNAIEDILRHASEITELKVE
jgi:hypothetical protein